jgi:hypothetical protein
MGKWIQSKNKPTHYQIFYDRQGMVSSDRDIIALAGAGDRCWLPLRNFENALGVTAWQIGLQSALRMSSSG